MRRFSMFSFRQKRPIKVLSHQLESLVRGRLWLQVLLGLVAGLGLGIALGPDLSWVSADKSAIITAWLALPGELFLRLITMVLIPLVTASIIRGLGGTTDTKNLKKIGVKFGFFVVCTTTFASVVGLTLARLLHPGTYVRSVQVVGTPATVTPQTLPSIIDIPMAIVNLIPRNPLASAIEGEMLGIVVFAIIAGLALALHKNTAIEQLLKLVDGILEVCMTIVKWALWLAPWAVFGLMARTASQTGVATLAGMLVYIFTVLLGLLILYIVYLLLVTLLGSMSPLKFIRAIAPVQLLAFSASSSAAVLPFSMKIAEEQLNVDQKITKVVLPLGATINMDGTALYQSVAILFLAQTAGLEFGLVESFLVVLTLVLASIGAPSVPGVGMIILSSVAVNFGVPVAALPLLLGVDRLLDMSRTALNVTGDLTACVIFGKKQ